MKHWLKGNTHAHTTNSDGDAPPDSVVAWYEEHGYDFLAITDHNHLTPPTLDRLVSLTLIPAEEVTLPLHVHINGLGLREVILPPRMPAGMHMAEQKVWLVEQAIAAIEAQGALAHVNHPNYNWAVSTHVLDSVANIRFMEVFNGHPLSLNEGTPHGSSVESKWDHMLSQGRLVYGLATDDAHHYGTFDPIMANPGRGWIYVDAERNDEDGILAAMRAGQFYASTGIRLAEIDCRHRCLHVVLDSDRPQTIELVGDHGRVLEHEHAIEARFDLPAAQRYLRARVIGNMGERAWLQPILQAQGEGS